MNVKPKVLYTTPVLQYPAAGGPYLRIENSIKALSGICDLTIYSRVPLHELGGAEGLSFYRQHCEDFYFAPFSIFSSKHARFSKRAVNFLARRTIKRDIFGLAPGSQEIGFRRLLRIADTIQTDVIWLGYGSISYPLLRYIKQRSNYKVVVDTDSVDSRVAFRGLPYAQNAEERQQLEKAGREKEEEERWGTQLADVMTAVSDVDAEYYRELAKSPQQIHIFSNVIDLETYQQVVAPPEHFKKPCMYLAGSFGPRSAMDDAARWVINKVLPLVRQQIADIHFYIIGSGSDRTLSDIHDEGITITGKLPSVLPYLCHADVALVPLRFESGTRFKILEAGACGIPVVSTTLGAEGIPVTHEKDILIADEPQSFANAIVRLTTNRDSASAVAASLGELVQERYSVAVLAQQGRKILDYLT